MSVSWFIGIPAAGKTTLALALAADAAVARGVPMLVVDAEGDARTSRGVAARTPEGWLELLKAGHKLCTWRAADASPDTVAAWASAIERRGRCVVVIDGAHALLSAHSRGGDAWVRLQRVHRHANLDLFWTTHHLGGDIPQVVQACAPVLYVFRTTSPAALRTLESEYGLDPERIKALPQGAYVRLQGGFA